MADDVEAVLGVGEVVMTEEEEETRLDVPVDAGLGFGGGAVGELAGEVTSGLTVS